MPEQKMLTYLVIALVVGGLMAFRLRRMSRTQPLKLERLWILPAVLALAAVVTLVQLPPQPADWPWLIAALVIGGGLGWMRGSMMAISIDADTHVLSAKASPAAIVLLMAVFALRFGLRAAIARNAATWHIGAALITDAFIVFAVALLGVSRIEMAIRGRRLLVAARQARAAA